MADKRHPNNVRSLREAQLMSKAELARKAGISPLTIDRVEAGKPSRMDTKRKIILALGYKLADRDKVFPEIEDEKGRPRPRRDREDAPAEAEPAAPETARRPSRAANEQTEEAGEPATPPPAEQAKAR